MVEPAAPAAPGDTTGASAASEPPLCLPPEEDDEWFFDDLDALTASDPVPALADADAALPSCGEPVHISALSALVGMHTAPLGELCLARGEHYASLTRAGRVVGLLSNVLPARATGFRGLGAGSRIGAVQRSYKETERIQDDVVVHGRKVFVLVGGRVAWLGVSTKPLRPRRSQLIVSPGP